MPNYRRLTSALSFPNTNVVVIGGTQGIGAGIATRFAELGASVLVVGRNETLGSEMVKTLEAAAQ
jgi:NAD(P)-dependent dehydrogenase (short-subunit alcohol dehydrogenase family)